MTGQDHRHHPRTFFEPDAGVRAEFDHSAGNRQPFPAVVMNISVGGIGIATRETLSGRLQKGDSLVLKRLKVRESNTAIRGLHCQVQWVLEEPGDDKRLLGLEFQTVDPLMLGVLRRFIGSFES